MWKHDVIHKTRNTGLFCGAGNWKGLTTVSVEPVARYCKQLTVGGTQVLPSVDSGGRNAVVRQVLRCTAVQTPVNCHCQLEKHPVRTSSQWSSSCSIWPGPRSNVQVPVTTRAAALNTRCKLTCVCYKKERNTNSQNCAHYTPDFMV